MKLKYYLRGAGTGIIIATLVLMIAFTFKGNDNSAANQPLTEKESSTIAEAIKDNELKDVVTPIVEATPTVEPTIETTKLQEGTVAADITSDVESVATATENDSVEEYKPFTVQKGQSSNQVAIALMEAGFISDSDDFNKFITDLGMSNKIQPGSFYIKSGSSYDDIAALLVTKPENRSTSPEQNENSN